MPTIHQNQPRIRTVGYDPEIAKDIVHRLEASYPEAAAQIDGLLDATGARTKPGEGDSQSWHPLVLETSGELTDAQLNKLKSATATLHYAGVPFAIVHGSSMRAAGADSITPDQMPEVRAEVAATGARIANALRPRLRNVLSLNSGLLSAELSDPQNRGSVREVTGVDTDPIQAALSRGMLPIVGSLGTTQLRDGESASVYVPRTVAWKAVSRAMNSALAVPVTEPANLKRAVFAPPRTV